MIISYFKSKKALHYFHWSCNYPKWGTATAYTQFLKELPVLLDDIPLGFRRAMWFMHDGAPVQFSIRALQCLNETYPSRWIGRDEIQFSQLDHKIKFYRFFCWGHLKAFKLCIRFFLPQSLKKPYYCFMHVFFNLPLLMWQPLCSLICFNYAIYTTTRVLSGIKTRNHGVQTQVRYCWTIMASNRVISDYPGIFDRICRSMHRL